MIIRLIRGIILQIDCKFVEIIVGIFYKLEFILQEKWNVNG